MKKSEIGIWKAEKDLGVFAVKHGRGGARPYRRFVNVTLRRSGPRGLGRSYGGLRRDGGGAVVVAGIRESCNLKI